MIGRAGASPPSRCAGALLYRFLYIYVIRRCHLLVPAGPALRANVKPHPVTLRKVEDLLLSELACSKQVLASVLRLTRFGLPLTSSTLGGQLPFAASLRAAKASCLGPTL